MTDPYLLSGSEDKPGPPPPVDRIGELALQMRVPRAMLDGMPPQALDQIEQTAAHIEANHETWGHLADSIASQLTAAGFRPHTPRGHRGGFHLSLWENGVIVAWSTTEYPEDSVSPFEKTVEDAVHPALEQILQAAGFTARIIPAEEDSAGCIRVTGWHGPAGIQATTEQ